jgi:hypothetical protein
VIVAVDMVYDPEIMIFLIGSVGLLGPYSSIEYILDHEVKVAHATFPHNCVIWSRGTIRYLTSVTPAYK